MQCEEDAAGKMKKKLRNYYLHFRNPHTLIDRKWIFPLTIASLISFFLLTNSTPLLPFYRSIALSRSPFIESKLHTIPVSTHPLPPRFAYLISGSIGDGKMLKRTLQALYHPGNQYVVHLDLEATEEERLGLERYVEGESVFRRFGNVRMIKKANLVTYKGPTMVANTLNAAAILLKEGGEWDWFINLSATDYPLVTQDGELIEFL